MSLRKIFRLLAEVHLKLKPSQCNSGEGIHRPSWTLLSLPHAIEAEQTKCRDFLGD